jgi:PEP-CTERM motif
MKRLLLSLALTTLLPLGAAFAGTVFVTGHDPIWHSFFGGNAAGANNLATAGIDFARGGSALPFLFVESKAPTPIPAGNARTAPFLTSQLGYASTDFIVMNAADLAALPDFRIALSGFSAIVVASDHGGMLTAAELMFLNSHATDILDYINAGGGLYAEAESNTVGLIGATPRFGFLPFLVSSTDFNAAELTNSVTPFGAAAPFLLTNADVNGNFSHNFFASTGGMNPVDLFNGNPAQPLTLAFSGQLTPGGVVPEPSSLALAVLGLLGLVFVVAGRGNGQETCAVPRQSEKCCVGRARLIGR